MTVNDKDRALYWPELEKYDELIKAEIAEGDTLATTNANKYTDEREEALKKWVSGTATIPIDQLSGKMPTLFIRCVHVTKTQDTANNRWKYSFEVSLGFQQGSGSAYLDPTEMSFYWDRSLEYYPKTAYTNWMPPADDYSEIGISVAYASVTFYNPDDLDITDTTLYACATVLNNSDKPAKTMYVYDSHTFDESYKTADAAVLAEAKEYTDTKISEIPDPNYKNIRGTVPYLKIVETNDLGLITDDSDNTVRGINVLYEIMYPTESYNGYSYIFLYKELTTGWTSVPSYSSISESIWNNGDFTKAEASVTLYLPESIELNSASIKINKLCLYNNKSEPLELTDIYTLPDNSSWVLGDSETLISAKRYTDDEIAKIPEPDYKNIIGTAPRIKIDSVDCQYNSTNNAYYFQCDIWATIPTNIYTDMMDNKKYAITLRYLSPSGLSEEVTKDITYSGGFTALSPGFETDTGLSSTGYTSIHGNINLVVNYDIFNGGYIEVLLSNKKNISTPGELFEINDIYIIPTFGVNDGGYPSPVTNLDSNMIRLTKKQSIAPKQGIINITKLSWANGSMTAQIYTYAGRAVKLTLYAIGGSNGTLSPIITTDTKTVPASGVTSFSIAPEFTTQYVSMMLLGAYDDDNGELIDTIMFPWPSNVSASSIVVNSIDYDAGDINLDIHGVPGKDYILFMYGLGGTGLTRHTIDNSSSYTTSSTTGTVQVDKTGLNLKGKTSDPYQFIELCLRDADYTKIAASLAIPVPQESTASTPESSNILGNYFILFDDSTGVLTIQTDLSATTNPDYSTSSNLAVDFRIQSDDGSVSETHITHTGLVMSGVLGTATIGNNWEVLRLTAAVLDDSIPEYICYMPITVYNPTKIINIEPPGGTSTPSGTVQSDVLELLWEGSVNDTTTEIIVPNAINYNVLFAQDNYGQIYRGNFSSVTNTIILSISYSEKQDISTYVGHIISITLVPSTMADTYKINIWTDTTTKGAGIDYIGNANIKLTKIWGLNNTIVTAASPDSGSAAAEKGSVVGYATAELNEDTCSIDVNVACGQYMCSDPDYMSTCVIDCSASIKGTNFYDNSLYEWNNSADSIILTYDSSTSYYSGSIKIPREGLYMWASGAVTMTIMYVGDGMMPVGGFEIVINNPKYSGRYYDNSVAPMGSLIGSLEITTDIDESAGQQNRKQTVHAVLHCGTNYCTNTEYISGCTFAVDIYDLAGPKSPHKAQYSDPGTHWTGTLTYNTSGKFFSGDVLIGHPASLEWIGGNLSIQGVDPDGNKLGLWTFAITNPYYVDRQKWGTDNGAITPADGCTLGQKPLIRRYGDVLQIHFSIDTPTQSASIGNMTIGTIAPDFAPFDQARYQDRNGYTIIISELGNITLYWYNQSASGGPKMFHGTYILNNSTSKVK